MGCSVRNAYQPCSQCSLGISLGLLWWSLAALLFPHLSSNWTSQDSIGWTYGTLWTLSFILPFPHLKPPSHSTSTCPISYNSSGPSSDQFPEAIFHFEHPWQGHSFVYMTGLIVNSFAVKVLAQLANYEVIEEKNHACNMCLHVLSTATWCLTHSRYLIQINLIK